MSKKVLLIAAKANMIQQFNHRNIKILQSLGYKVYVATNLVDFGSMSSEENEKMKDWLKINNVVSYQVDFERRMGTLKGNIKAIGQLNKIFKNEDFLFVHVQSPLGSVLGRLLAKMHHVPTIYTAHGFHFFKGGPKINWFVFFPLEWFFSFLTDFLITINDEDFALAKRVFHAKKNEQINGIGVDVDGLRAVSEKTKNIARKSIREELKIPEDAILISSVGELSDRKNHKVVLEAIKMMEKSIQKKIYYVIAGTGPNYSKLKSLATSFNFEDNLILLGYRNDIHSINYASDISIFPSFQEGLGVAGLDAVVDGTFLIGSDVRGISDYIKPGINGEVFLPNNPKMLKNIMYEVIKQGKKAGDNKFLVKFSDISVDNKMTDIYIEAGKCKKK